MELTGKGTAVLKYVQITNQERYNGKNQIFEKLNESLHDLEKVENEISMVELAVYHKSIEELENLKLNELRENF